MSTSGHGRKRPRNAMAEDVHEFPADDGDKSDEYSSTLLVGVVGCLSGFAHDQKDELHKLIVSMGGRYVQELIWCFGFQ
jgi:hypothetical protein